MSKARKWSRRKRRGQPRRPEGGEVITFTGALEVLCPDCGLRVQVGYESDGTPMGMHAMPPCQTYLNLQLDEYVKYVRLKLQGTTDA